MESTGLSDFEPRYTTAVFDSVTLYSSNAHSPGRAMPTAGLPETSTFPSQLLPLPIDMNPSNFDNNHHFYLSPDSCAQSISGPLMQFDPSLSYFAPELNVPEAVDAHTPVSAHASIIRSSCSPAPYASPLPTHLTLGHPQQQNNSGSFGLSLSNPYATERRNSSTGVEGHPSGHPTPMSSPHPGFATTQHGAEIPDPAARRYPPIAPNLTGSTQHRSNKRSLDLEDESEPGPSKRRQYSISTTSGSPKPQSELSEEDILLLKLKDEEALTWKDVASRFQTELGKSYQIPALQMRLKRLKERLRTWTDGEVRALRLAHDYWASNKWEIIASKMAEFGATEKWTHKQCNKKWDEISRGPTQYFFNTSLSNPPISTINSVETPLEISLNSSPPTYEEDASL